MLFLTAFVAALALPAVFAEAGDKKPIVICGTTWGKYGGDDLPGKGFVPDLMMRVFRDAGYEVRTELVPWPRCVERAKAVKYDLIASAWRGKNFAPHFDYLNVILHDTVNFVTLADTSIASGDVSAFKGKRVGYVREAGGLAQIFAGQTEIRTVEVAVLKKLLPMLERGRIDAIATDPVNLNELVKTLDPPLKKKLKALQPPLQINYNSPQIAKHHPDKARIIADFDRSYKKPVKQGLYDELIKLHDLQVQYPK